MIYTTQKPNADELITQALRKIESDVKNYDIFIKMLSTVVGLQDIVEKIKGMLYNTFPIFINTCTHEIETVIFIASYKFLSYFIIL